jgi:glucose/mannose-6-phosphate isomerase
VLLDGDAVHPRNRLRVRLTAEALAKNGIPHEVVDAGGRTAIAAALRAAYLGDWVSLYLAALNEVDPTPTPILDGVKAALAGE